MKVARATLFSLALLLGVTATADAFAGGGHRGGNHHRGGVGFGLFVGAPAYWYYPPAYYPYYSPYYYPPAYYPPVVASAPPVYVERGQTDAALTPPQTDYWYYCRESNAYHPYVEQCAGPWERVPPRPAS